MTTALFIIGYIIIGLFTGRATVRLISGKEKGKDMHLYDADYFGFAFTGIMWPVVLPILLIIGAVLGVKKLLGGRNPVYAFINTDLIKAIGSKEEKR